MANTQPARFTFSVLDGLGTRAAITDYAMIDPAMTVAQAVAAWGAQATALDAMLDAQIVGGGVEIVRGPTGKGAPVSTSRVEQTGVFNLLNATTPHRYGIAVAGLADAVIEAGRILLTEDGVVDTWLDIIEAAITGGGVYTNQAQQAVTTLADAFLSFRKRRKQLSRSSRELGPD